MPPLRNTALRVFRSPWLVVAAGIWVQCLTGAVYDFGVYSESIKESLGYDQEQLESVTFWKNIGSDVGVLAGLLHDASPAWVSLAVSAVLNFFGYLMTWLSITNRIPTPSLWVTCVYALVAANAKSFSDTAVVVTCVKIFPKTRGTVVGLMKACLGLSGALLLQFYYAAYGSNEEQFPLLVAWLGTTGCIAFMFIIRPLPVIETGDTKQNLKKFSAVVLILAVYLLSVIIIQSFLSIERPYKIAVAGGLIVILICPIWLAIKSELKFGLDPVGSEALLCKTDLEKFSLRKCEELGSTLQNNGEEFGPTQESVAPQEAILLSPSRDKDGSSKHIQISNALDCLKGQKVQGSVHPQRGENFSLLQAVFSLDFWFLFFASASGMGSGVTTINTMSQLGSSLGYSSNEISNLISLWSIWSFAGRLGVGHVLELYLGLSRSLFLVITLVSMVIGNVIIAIAFPGALYVGSVILGICYGALWSLMPSIASELFGLKNFGAIFNTIGAASPLSSYILSVKIVGYLYDLESGKGSSSCHISSARIEWWSYSLSSSSSCTGIHCFRLSFFIMAGVSMAGALISAVLFLRTRTFYKERSVQLNIPMSG